MLPILEGAWATALMVFVMAGVGLLGFAVTQAFGVETRGADIVGRAADSIPATLADEAESETS